MRSIQMMCSLWYVWHLIHHSLVPRILWMDRYLTNGLFLMMMRECWTTQELCLEIILLISQMVFQTSSCIGMWWRARQGLCCQTFHWRSLQESNNDSLFWSIRETWIWIPKWEWWTLIVFWESLICWELLLTSLVDICCWELKLLIDSNNEHNILIDFLLWKRVHK